jgi:hypothetical protein
MPNDWKTALIKTNFKKCDRTTCNYRGIGLPNFVYKSYTNIIIRLLNIIIETLLMEEHGLHKGTDCVLISRQAVHTI